MKVMDTKRARLLVLPALLGGLLALSPFAPAKAEWSAACSDNTTNPHYQFLDGDDFGIPLLLGVEWGVITGNPGSVAVCYGTGRADDPKVLGGIFGVNVVPTGNGADVKVINYSDSNAGIRPDNYNEAKPRFTLSPGGTGGGQVLTFEIPVKVCSGVCYPTGDPGLSTTGVIVGTISSTPAGPGGTSASYALNGLCVKVDGVTVVGNCTTGFGNAGVTTTGTNPVNTSPTTPGPCVLSTCAPNYNYIGTTGNQIAWLYVPGLAPIPVYGVHTCLYQKDASTPCPY